MGIEDGVSRGVWDGCSSCSFEGPILDLEACSAISSNPDKDLLSAASGSEPGNI